MTKEIGEKNTGISARIAEIIERVGENPSSFAKCLGYSRAQTIYDILSGKSAPSYDFFRRFADTEFSANIDLQWLLTGKGDVLKTKCTPQQKDLIPASDNGKGSNKSPNSHTLDTDFFEKLLAAKDATIREQAEEIGCLKEQIRQMQHRLEKDALDASISGTANVG